MIDMAADTITLYRPVSRAELNEIKESGWTKYTYPAAGAICLNPLINCSYAEEIIKKQALDEFGECFIIKFEVDAEHINKYEIKLADNYLDVEINVPPDCLDEFSRHIIGKIEQIEVFNKE